MAKEEKKKRTIWNTGLKDLGASRNEAFVAFLLSCVGLIIIGVYVLRPNAIVSEEIITGILAADGILFGFWAALLGVAPKGEKAKWKHLNVIKKGVFFSLAVLVASVFLMYGYAVGLLPSSYVMFLAVYSFYFTSVFLGISLYYGMFEG